MSLLSPDQINGLFEFVGALFILLGHCRRVLRDKLVRGASWTATGFFFGWGLWNLYYYPHLDQWWSFTGGCAIVAANCLWLYLMVYYTVQERRRLIAPHPTPRRRGRFTLW